MSFSIHDTVTGRTPHTTHTPHTPHRDGAIPAGTAKPWKDQYDAQICQHPFLNPSFDCLLNEP